MFKYSAICIFPIKAIFIVAFIIALWYILFYLLSIVRIENILWYHNDMRGKIGSNLSDCF